MDPTDASTPSSRFTRVQRTKRPRTSRATEAAPPEPAVEAGLPQPAPSVDGETPREYVVHPGAVMIVAMLPDGKLVMDFNRARNPPCAYNQWTTCPLPPAPNKLAVRIEAGEKRYHGDAAGAGKK